MQEGTLFHSIMIAVLDGLETPSIVSAPRKNAAKQLEMVEILYQKGEILRWRILDYSIMHYTEMAGHQKIVDARVIFRFRISNITTSQKAF
jgi:uncharacterized Fe-S cluster-containing protein